MDHDSATQLDARLSGDTHHQMSNLLARVRSILNRTVDAGGSAEDMIDHFRGRLDALGRRELARAAQPGGTIDLEELIRGELFEFWLGNDPRIAITGPVCRISHEQALPLGLALHELVTNAYKFGALAPSTNHVRLTIDWTMNGDHLSFRWRETGIAIVASAPIRQGFGTTYLESALSYELDADVALDRQPGALTWCIWMPLAGSSIYLERAEC